MYIPEKHHRRSIRIPGFDYTQSGAYFITLCTRFRARLFGEIVDGNMRLSEAGRIVLHCWQKIPSHFPKVTLDAFVVMPDHVHGILFLSTRRDTAGPAQTTGKNAPDGQPKIERFGRPVPGSVPTIVRSFKAAVTKGVNELRGTPGTVVWQRNYYERVIRNDEEWDRIWQYILDNPKNWNKNKIGPAAG